MSRMLPDKEIEALLNNAILGGSAECVRSNSYVLRLGRRVKFDSTQEEMDIPDGHFLEVQPGDFVTIASLERLDFTRDTLSAIGRPNDIVGFITPTTTMMR